MILLTKKTRATHISRAVSLAFWMAELALVRSTCEDVSQRFTSIDASSTESEIAAWNALVIQRTPTTVVRALQRTHLVVGHCSHTANIVIYSLIAPQTSAEEQSVNLNVNFYSISIRDVPNIRFAFASAPKSYANSVFVFGRIV